VKRARRLIIVANRLPVERVRSAGKQLWKCSPGGLVTALEPVLRQRGGAWIGWSGIAGPAQRPFVFDGLAMRPVRLSADEVETYYQGFSNATLWPLYHDAIRTPVFDPSWWEPYVRVNQRFAEAAAAAAQPGDTVWVHDYQLQLVPAMLRKLKPSLRIGFFLHIPFPPAELFAWLPWRTQILEGLLGADVVGFQTPSGAQNFARLARQFTAATSEPGGLRFRSRRIVVDDYPISIDTPWFENASVSPRAVRSASEIRRRIGPARQLILGVDRLDYTKGIDERLRAYELLLRRKVVSVDKFVFMQIAVPTRELVADYSDIRRRTEQRVGQINGDFSVPGHVAVHFFRRSFSRDDLVAFYLAADIMTVTPLRDGMNLVAKEYVATRTGNTGALVLSEFAGAAHELKRAILVNPRDIEGSAAALEHAVAMPAREARARMRALRAVVRRHDVHRWAHAFLGAMAT